MKALGIDPGLADTGWAIIRHDKRGFACEGSGTITTITQFSQSARLMQIWRSLEIDVAPRADKIHLAAIENVIVGANMQTTIKSAEAVGVIKLWLEFRKLAANEFQPATLKKHVAGSGKATKADMRAAVEDALSSRVLLKTSHEVDAAAAAIMLLRAESTY